MKAIYAISYIEAWKSQEFNEVWTRDLAIPLPCSNQLSYEATDVGSWSFVGPKETKTANQQYERMRLVVLI